MRGWIIMVTVMVGVFAAASVAAVSVNEMAPGLAYQWTEPIDAFGDLLFTYDLENSPDCNLMLGVEYVEPNFYVTGACKSPNNNVYIFDGDGNYLDSFQQNNAHDWGWRDMAWDGAYLYASYSNQIDYFTLDGVVAGSFTGPEEPNRALAYDPATDHFWTANFSSDIYEFDRDGAVINQFDNDYSIYGMAWDGISPDGPWLWVHEQDNNMIRQFDPVAGNYTGVSTTNYVGTGGVAGGLGFIGNWDQADGLSILVALNQADPDHLAGIEVLSWLEGTVQADFTNNPPSIDGSISSCEWDDAWVLDMTGGSMPFYLYLMDDANYLYGAVDAIGDPSLTNYDQFRIYFDNENDGLLPGACVPGVTMEGFYRIMRMLNQTHVNLYTLWDNGGVPTPCDTINPSAFVGAMGVSAKGNVQYEFRLDMDGGEMYGALGEEIGIMFTVYNAGSGTGLVWPTGGVVEYPDTYGDLLYKDCDGCFIEDFCWSAGTINPGNECEICQPGASPDAWSNRGGFVCGDDGLFCNGDEVCESGQCIGHTGDPCGDDGVFCNGTEFCNEDYDECEHTGNPCLDDGLFCNGDEYCMELFDMCGHTGDPCPPGTTCIELLDECLAADDDVVDDDTVDDDLVDDDVVDDDVVDDDVVDDDMDDDMDDDLNDDTGDDDVGDDDVVGDDDTADDDADDDDAGISGQKPFEGSEGGCSC